MISILLQKIAALRFPDVLFFFTITVVIFFVTAFLGNIILLSEFFQNTSSFSWTLTLKLFFLLLWNTFPSTLSRTLAIVISLLFALNILLLWKSARWQSLLKQKLGLAGIVSAVLGIGCLACSGLLPVAAISLFGAGFIGTILPYQSLFFQLLSLILLALSTVFILRVITKKNLLSPPARWSANIRTKISTLAAFGAMAMIALVLMFFLYRDALGYYAWQRFQAPHLATFLIPDDPALRFEIGNYYFGESPFYDKDLAKAQYEAVIALDDRFPGAHYQLSRILFIDGELHASLDTVNQEIAHHPEYTRSYYVRGLVYGYLGLYENAARDFETFVAANPDIWAGYNDLAWIYFQMGEYEKTLEVSEKALSHNPENVWLLNSRGVALMNLGRESEARETFEKALPLALTMSPLEWGLAYPGNDPVVYEQGLTAMQDSIKKNLELLSRK